MKKSLSLTPLFLAVAAAGMIATGCAETTVKRSGSMGKESTTYTYPAAARYFMTENTILCTLGESDFCEYELVWPSFSSSKSSIEMEKGLLESWTDAVTSFPHKVKSLFKPDTPKDESPCINSEYCFW